MLQVVLLTRLESILLKKKICLYKTLLVWKANFVILLKTIEYISMLKYTIYRKRFKKQMWFMQSLEIPLVPFRLNTKNDGEANRKL